MDIRRLFSVFALELRLQTRRPLVLSLLFLVGLVIWGLSTGDVMLGTSGSSLVGGKRLWLTSELSVSQVFAVVASVFYCFFVALAAGMGSLRDDELQVRELLRGTPLEESEYVWGKFLAVLAVFVLVLGAHFGLMIYFFHGPGSVGREAFLGPFEWRNYLVPCAVFGLPNVAFVAGLSFALGYWTRRAVLVYFLPIVLATTSFFFFWSFSPSWLDPRINRLLMWLDPTGNRWLQETWLEVDRGADFYNHLTLEYDLPFLTSRLAVVGIAVLAVVSCHSVPVKSRVRSVRDAQPAVRRLPDASAACAARDRACPTRILPGPGGVPGLWQGVAHVARAELQELRSSPGLYLFVPLVLIQTIANALLATGAFDTPILLTPGWLAVFEINFLTAWLCPLLLVYGVESLERERSSGLAEIYFSTPLRTAAILLGKAAGLLAVVGAVLLAVLAADLIALAVQGEVPFAVAPFALTWGLLLMPTFFVWIAFVTATWSVTGSRAGTYAAALAAFGFTLYRQFAGEMTWVGNWLLWGSVRWTDLGAFQLHRKPLVLNRVFVVLLAVAFLAVAVRALARRQRDGHSVLRALRPRSLARRASGLALVALPALAVGGALWNEVERGPGSDAAQERLKDYWRKNLATWEDRRVPALARVDLDLELEPGRRRFRMAGSYELVNHHDEALARIPLTAGPHWRDLRWTLDGEPCQPEDRAGLFVFQPGAPLEPEARLTIGFAYEAEHPPGASRNGGGASEFVLAAGIGLDNVLSIFEGRPPSFVPHVGYRSDLGVDDDNRFEEAEFPDDYYKSVVEPGFAPRSFDTRIRIRGPAEYTYNSVGVLVADEVEGGRRTVVWESDHPVRLFNVVAGRWAVRRGEGTAVYYHPGHTYNLDEIAETLDAARRYYSEWFAPYPWRELKLSELPGLSSNVGGTGFPTNITFSESAGFLTRNDLRAHATFLVTAHESAHQWWANVLTPGYGPGAVLLSEGMAHFSTLLLFEQVKGEAARMEFAKRLEARYGKRRRVDMERPLVRLMMDRPGDFTLAYDKGGLVFWMLLEHLGRERMLEGVRTFIAAWRDGPDHPLLEDFVEAMRPFADDPEAFDRFAEQWFFDVVAPEYQLEDARRREVNDGEWLVRVEVTNRGRSTMPVEVAAVRAERFDAEGRPRDEYRDARTSVTLAAGESRRVTIRAHFEPERIVVDPDVRVLQLNRSGAVFRF